MYAVKLILQQFYRCYTILVWNLNLESAVLNFRLKCNMNRGFPTVMAAWEDRGRLAKLILFSFGIQGNSSTHLGIFYQNVYPYSQIPNVLLRWATVNTF